MKIRAKTEASAYNKIKTTIKQHIRVNARAVTMAKIAILKLAKKFAIWKSLQSAVGWITKLIVMMLMNYMRTRYQLGRYVRKSVTYAVLIRVMTRSLFVQSLLKI